MTALGLDRDLVAVRAYRVVHHHMEAVTVEGHKAFHPVSVVVCNGTATLQIAQTLLAGVSDKENAGLARDVMLNEILGAQHHHRQVGGIVAHAGALEGVLCFHKGHGLQVGKYRVGVGHKHGNGAVLAYIVGTDYIQRFVDENALCADVFKPLFAKLCPLFFVMGRSGNGAQIPDQLLELLLGCVQISLHFGGKDHSYTST